MIKAMLLKRTGRIETEPLKLTELPVPVPGCQGVSPVGARIPLHTDLEVYPLVEANQVLQRMKDSRIRGTAELQIGNQVIS